MLVGPALYVHIAAAALMMVGGAMSLAAMTIAKRRGRSSVDAKRMGTRSPLRRRLLPRSNPANRLLPGSRLPVTAAVRSLPVHELVARTLQAATLATAA